MKNKWNIGTMEQTMEHHKSIQIITLSQNVPLFQCFLYIHTIINNIYIYIHIALGVPVSSIFVKLWNIGTRSNL